MSHVCPRCGLHPPHEGPGPLWNTCRCPPRRGQEDGPTLVDDPAEPTTDAQRDAQRGWYDRPVASAHAYVTPEVLKAWADYNALRALILDIRLYYRPTRRPRPRFRLRRACARLLRSIARSLHNPGPDPQ